MSRVEGSAMSTLYEESLMNFKRHSDATNSECEVMVTSRNHTAAYT